MLPRPVTKLWRGDLQVLASLHLQPERVHFVKPSAQLAREARARHDFDKAVDTEQVQAQRYFSALVTWERLLAHIAASAHMADNDFALAFEDDVALHDDLSHAAARAAILRGLVTWRAARACCSWAPARRSSRRTRPPRGWAPWSSANAQACARARWR